MIQPYKILFDFQSFSTLRSVNFKTEVYESKFTKPMNFNQL